MWTRPVPSSVVTKSPARTGKAAPALAAAVGEREERALVAAADQLGAGHAVEDLDPLAQHLLDQRLGQDQGLAVDVAPRT